MFLFLTTAQTKTVQQNMTVERLLHRVASCRSAADDANLFSCPHEDCTQPAKETVERRVTKLNHCNSAVEKRHLQFFSLARSDCHCPRHLKLKAMERSLWQQHVVFCPPCCLFSRGVLL